MRFFPLRRPDPVKAATALAVLALAAGVGVWGAILLAPRPAALPPGLTAPPPPRADASPVAQWFGATASTIKVAIVGLIAAGEQGTAVLRVDGQPPQAYRVGQSLAQGVVLAEVQPDGVVLLADGATQRVQAPPAPALGSPGFVKEQ
ncbi:type II secretion system protein N [Orrella sp. JC864]|uniref:type II secretion system protein N n=1 Tax=Orrella sp. JC864 TaxID=3120298 RepID=UPI0012BB4CA9